MADWYMEIIDCRGGGSKTGKGAAWPTEEVARRRFDAARTLEVPEDMAEFLVDLHDGEGNLLDTLQVDARGFEALVGEPPKTVEEYDAYDASYWRGARERSAVGVRG